MSWGKIDRNASRAMAWVEPTVALPMLVTAAVQEKIAGGRTGLQLSWKGQILEKISRVEGA